MKRLALFLGTLLVLNAVAPAVQAQEIVDEALQVFTTRTERLEYLHSAELRGLSNYSVLRQRYLGGDLRDLEKSLAALGIDEGDVDELVLGWDAAIAGKDSGTGGLYGLAGGHFRGEEIAKRAVEQRVEPTQVGDAEAYCPGSQQGTTCIVLFDDTRGAFGSLNQLSEMLAARAGSGQGLISNNSFADLVNGARPDAPIWGHAESSAAAEWMRASIPGQDSMQMNWSRLLSGVDSLAYAIKPGEKVHLQMTFSCKSQAAAADLRLLLDGLRLVEKMAWLGKNPKAPNPFENVELDSSGDSVELQLDTPAPTT